MDGFCLCCARECVCWTDHHGVDRTGICSEICGGNSVSGGFHRAFAFDLELCCVPFVGCIRYLLFFMDIGNTIHSNRVVDMFDGLFLHLLRYTAVGGGASQCGGVGGPGRTRVSGGCLDLV